MTSTTRRFLITGGSQGIGAALVAQARKAGHQVVFTGRNEAHIQQIASQTGAHGIRADVASDADNQRVVEECAAKMGGIDVLINNAAFGYNAEIGSLDMSKMRELFATNVFGAVDMTNRVAPQMKERGDGDIVNVHMVAFGVSAYAASKAALEMFTEGLYVELAATGVRAHLFVPGTTLSEFSADKPGNDAPFPTDPATASTSEQVAVALLDAVGSDRFRSFTSEREETTAASREADVNAWLARMRTALSPKDR